MTLKGVPAVETCTNSPVKVPQSSCSDPRLKEIWFSNIPSLDVIDVRSAL